MDDFSVNSLIESQNEWCARLVSILTPLIISGFRSIFDEAWKLCRENDEESKYLMTFQNFIARITKWNPSMIKDETNRIKEASGCGYLEELVTCVHIIKLKALTCARAGQKQKKVSVNIPQLEDFIHKVYINTARKIYTNVYLFDKNCQPLQIQKHNRELETIIKECILLTIRDSIPVEGILRAYLDETQETDVEVEEKEEIIETEIPPEELPPPPAPPVVSSDDDNKTHSGGNSYETSENKGLKFNDFDRVLDKSGNEESVVAPKTIERLEQISEINYNKRKLEEEEDSDSEALQIGGDISLDTLDVHDMTAPTVINEDPFIEFDTLV
jgi:hypothetical protein